MSSSESRFSAALPKLSLVISAIVILTMVMAGLVYALNHEASLGHTLKHEESEESHTQDTQGEDASDRREKKITDLIEIHRSLIQKQSNAPVHQSDVFTSRDFAENVALAAQGFIGLTPIDYEGRANERIYDLIGGTFNGVHAEQSARIAGFSKDGSLAYVLLSVFLPHDDFDASAIKALHDAQVRLTVEVADIHNIPLSDENSKKEITAFPIAVKSQDLLRLVRKEVEHERSMSDGIDMARSDFENAITLQHKG